MLNRTNRTLSAHLNRLNLGTRSLALKSGVNIDGQTLRSRHAHCVVMRDGMREHALDPVSETITGSVVSTRIPGLPIVPSWLIASPVVRAKVGLDVPVTLDAWPVPTDRPYPVEEPRNPIPGAHRSTDPGRETRSPPPIRGAIAGRERFCGRVGPSRLGFRCRDSRGVGRVSAVVPAQNRRIVGPMPGVEHASGSRSGDSRPVSGNPASRGRRSTCPQAG